jgi:hypothetical protein
MRPVIVQPKENIMSKTTFKNMFWMSLPLALAVGCAHTQPQTAPVYSDVPPRALAPTSERPVERVYAEQDSITRTAAPSGASAADWALNERIRGLLTGNKTLGPFPGEVMAVVDKQNHGLVRLSGTINNDMERKRMCDAIANVEGVTQVEDKMIAAMPLPIGSVDVRDPVPQ